jgi:hypothetical protein
LFRIKAIEQIDHARKHFVAEARGETRKGRGSEGKVCLGLS